VRDFLKALEKDNLPSPNFLDGVQNQAVLHAVEVSARSRGWEQVRWDPLGLDERSVRQEAREITEDNL
jgi:hypothetical protein